jgi:hypothetical protein
LISKHYTL